MRLTIIPSDKVVIKDGLSLHGLNFALANVRAIQWYEDHGEVEYLDGSPNKVIDDLSPYQSIIDAYDAEIVKLEAEAIEAAKLTWDKIRGVRDTDLQDSDWTQLLDAPVDAAKQLEWVTYRQELRDVPQTHVSEDLTKYKNTKDFKEKKFPKEPK